MNRAKRSFKDSPWWLVISLFVAALVGNGVIWQYQAAKLNTIKSAAEFRDREMAVYRDILRLADLSSRMYSEHFTTATPADFQRMMAPIEAQIGMRISDYEALEKQLASMEGRAPRKIPLDFLLPSAPSELRIEPGGP